MFEGLHQPLALTVIVRIGLLVFWLKELSELSNGFGDGYGI